MSNTPNSWENPSAAENDLTQRTKNLNLNYQQQQQQFRARAVNPSSTYNFAPGAPTFTPGAQAFVPAQYSQYGQQQQQYGGYGQQQQYADNGQYGQQQQYGGYGGQQAAYGQAPGAFYQNFAAPSPPIVMAFAGPAAGLGIISGRFTIWGAGRSWNCCCCGVLYACGGALFACCGVLFACWGVGKSWNCCCWGALYACWAGKGHDNWRRRGR